jgi:small-conductance mechanosensitive channel
MGIDLTHPLKSISWVITASPFAVPIWSAVLFLFCIIFRSPFLSLLFRVVGIQDQAVRHSIKKKIDTPLLIFLFLMAAMPFAFFVRQPAGSLLVLILHVFVFMLLFHIIIQATDLAVFSFWAKRSGTSVSSVVRFFVLAVMYAVAFLLLLDWGLGVSILPLLATSTVMTAVLGLALQDTLKNVFAGLNMSLEQSFKEGDWVSIRLDQNETWFGQIAEIGWRTTKIRTLNNNYAVIPNSQFTTRELINLTKPTNTHARTIDLAVNLRAEPNGIRQALLAAVKQTKGVLAEPEPEATPIAVKNTHVDFQVRFWMDDLEQREKITGAVIESCLTKLQELGALP